MKISIAITFSIICTILLPMQSKGQQIKNYDQEWKIVMEKIDNGLPASAYELTKKIYAVAKAEKQDAQMTKALIYMTIWGHEHLEKNINHTIKELEKEILESKEPATSILNNFMAQIYYTYFSNNRYRLYQRTNTVNLNKEDIATWTADDFHRQISKLYFLSIQNQKPLQQVKLSDYDALINKGNTRNLRPTLYDLLAQTTLDYFKNDEAGLSQPANHFEIDQQEAFAPAAEFAAFKFATKDSTSSQYQALLIFQNLIRFHLGDAKPDALIDIDLKRLEFVQEHSTLVEKDEQYIQAVKQVAEKYENASAAAQAWFLLAAWHKKNGDEYDADEDTTHQYELVKAKAIADKILDQKEKSEGWTNAYNMVQEIIQPDFSFETERVNLPDLPFRMRVKFKNTSKLYLRAIRATDEIKKAVEDSRYEEKKWGNLLAAKPLKSWEQNLPDNTDFQNHATEIKIDALPAGEYFILASHNPSFNLNQNVLASQLIYISNISYVNNENDFFVLHRNTGQPLSNAKIQLWEKTYNYNSSSFVYKKYESYTSDKNGFFRLTNNKPTLQTRRSNSFLFEITHNTEHLFLKNETFYSYYNSRTEPKEGNEFTKSIFLFTDRSIYRPGQTVYFKGIAVQKSQDEKKTEVISNHQTLLSLMDANNQKIDSLKLTTNEYGSISGKFTLPQFGMNGDFYISTEDRIGFISFKVEEYKRPKFFVEVEKPKGSYKLNDTIKVTGTAKTYAGNNIDGATVKYRVARAARFPYPWTFWRSFIPQSPSREIAHGETKTDADGKFEIDFKAIPDLSLNEKSDPVFDYIIYADVTDINGETRSATGIVSVAYKSLVLHFNIDKKLATTDLNKIAVSTQNMAGIFEKSNIEIKITALQPEQRLLRPRYWQKPDQHIMAKEEYITHFPNDIYENEDNPNFWEKGSTIYSQSATTDSTGIIRLNKHSIPAGNYIIEVSTKDKEGKLTKDQRFVELYNPKRRNLLYPQYLSTTNSQTIEPGEKTSIEIGSSAKDLYLIQSITKDSSVYTYHHTNSNTKSFEFSASEEDRGGYGTSFLFVKNNCVFQTTQTINVPWTNKQLKTEFITFRDKTLPGAAEKWTVKISGNKKEKIAAEMLVSMYDASLDQFYPHQWRMPSLWHNYINRSFWNSQNNFKSLSSYTRDGWETGYQSFEKTYDQLIFANMSFGPQLIVLRSLSGRPVQYKEAERSDAMIMLESVSKAAATPLPAASLMENKINKAKEMVETPKENDNFKVRTNFNETAFFFPELNTDKDGNISFSFTMPEALTKWKLQTLSHTKELAFGYSQKEIITQKELMVQPNPPRFMREGDKMEFSTKVVNLSNKEITGVARFQLMDAATGEAVDGWFKNAIPQQYFTIAAGQSQAIQFPIEIPFQFNKALSWRIVAKTKDGQLSDGEENMLPVPTNRMLVTETLPLSMRGSGTKNFSLEKLINSGSSETLNHQSLTVEFTSNPAWYAVQALPYMMEYPYDCAEQTWNRYFANALASHIANSSPKIKQIFEQWKTLDTAALQSNLQKNKELKAVLLEETPWVMDAKNETQQKKRLALLFDLVRMSGEQSKAYEKLRQLQSSNGGFVWFTGGPDDRYMTQYIITGIGHLKKLGASSGLQDANLNRLVQQAIPYLDRKISEDYLQLIRYKTDLKKYTPSHYVVQYLYMRSFFPEIKLNSVAVNAVEYFTERNQKTWMLQNKYMQAMIALSLHRNNDKITPKAILASLKETSILNEEMGMYYKDASRGWWWYQAPIERQALIIEAFEEIAKDHKTADDLRTWLLKNKQTNNWESTKSTAEAVYALLLKGTDWLSATTEVNINIGGINIFSKKDVEQNKTEAGTGYFKKIIEAGKVRPEMGNIEVQVKQPSNTSLPTWGGVYWQYFEDLDKITKAATPLQINKKLFVETYTENGPVLNPIEEGSKVKVGDKIRVRIELRADRDMEYVHMKDMRAATFEPVNVLSQYKWQGGLGYYESTKDASTNFFFDYLRKGTYVFEYSLHAQLPGNFSNGITSIQCMYAPEFGAHCEGMRVTVE